MKETIIKVWIELFSCFVLANPYGPPMSRFQIYAMDVLVQP